MLRIVKIVRNFSLLACLPILCGAIAGVATPTSNTGCGRTLTNGEMARTYGGADFIDKCLQDVPGCSDQDDYGAFMMMCMMNYNNEAGCNAAPVGFYNYGYLNTKGCEKPLIPGTGNLTCVQLEDDVVCSYFAECEYTIYTYEGYSFGSCNPGAGTASFWAPIAAFELFPCTPMPIP